MGTTFTSVIITTTVAVAVRVSHLIAETPLSRRAHQISSELARVLTTHPSVPVLVAGLVLSAWCPALVWSIRERSAVLDREFASSTRRPQRPCAGAKMAPLATIVHSAVLRVSANRSAVRMDNVLSMSLGRPNANVCHHGRVKPVILGALVPVMERSAVAMVSVCTTR